MPEGPRPEGDGTRARLERHGDVGVVVIDDPPLNLFGRELSADVFNAVTRAQDDGVRALVVRAEGEVFTAGADVNVFHGLSPDEAKGFTAQLIELAHKMEDLPFPTLSCAQGLCLTAGFELSLACDMIWASESAQFGLVEAVVGLTPLMGGTQRVAERAGPARAREFVMSAGLYAAETLERWNVVNRVLPADDLLEKTMRFAERLATGPTLAHLATKRMVRAYLDEGVRGADARVSEIASPLFGTEDLQKAVRSFLDQGPGKAAFEGR